VWHMPQRLTSTPRGVQHQMTEKALETDKTPVHDVQLLKRNAVGTIGVIFMAVATAAPITAMVGNVPIAVGSGNGSHAPAGYIVATVVLGLFAALALSTALLGIYGVLAYAVERRRTEFGVRRALGATERHILALVMRRGLLLAGVGTLAGLVGAALGARLMQSLLYGITAADPTSYVAAAALILTIVLAASWLPVRRAVQIDPARALRVD